jgi:hypothetical protein
MVPTFKYIFQIKELKNKMAEINFYQEELNVRIDVRKKYENLHSGFNSMRDSRMIDEHRNRCDSVFAEKTVKFGKKISGLERKKKENRSKRRRR